MTDANELQMQMSQVRSNLAQDVEQIVSNANTLSDWRYYARQYPWVLLGAAAAVGYMVIPRRIEVESPDVEALVKLAQQDRLVIQPKSEAVKEKGGVLGGLFSFAGNLLFRSALAYAEQQIGRIGRQSAGREAPSPEDTLSGPPDYPR